MAFSFSCCKSSCEWCSYCERQIHRIVVYLLTRERLTHSITSSWSLSELPFRYTVHYRIHWLRYSTQDMKKTGPDKHMSTGCALSCSIQCLNALKELHDVGFLHRFVIVESDSSRWIAVSQRHQTGQLCSGTRREGRTATMLSTRLRNV